jgi:hypothetical protein
VSGGAKGAPSSRAGQPWGVRRELRSSSLGQSAQLATHAPNPSPVPAAIHEFITGVRKGGGREQDRKGRGSEAVAPEEESRRAPWAYPHLMQGGRKRQTGALSPESRVLCLEQSAIRVRLVTENLTGLELDLQDERKGTAVVSSVRSYANDG